MFILKSILFAVIGAIVGLVIAFVLGIVIGLTYGAFVDSDGADRIINIIAWSLILGGMAIGFIAPIIEEVLRQRDEEAARIKREKKEQEALEQDRRSMALLLDSAQSRFTSLNSLIERAESHLDHAESELEERAFAPFWDHIEQCANKLGEFQEGASRTESDAKVYKERSSRLSISIPPFALPDVQLADARATARRLSSIVRIAQKDFQFATIYEQRKTNQLLHSGFGTLAEAIYGLQDAIVGAIDDLSVSIGMRLDDLIAVSKEQTDHLEALRAHGATIADESEKQSEMLDNIQRGHKPPEGTFDRLTHIRVKNDTRTAHDVAADDEGERSKG